VLNFDFAAFVGVLILPPSGLFILMIVGLVLRHRWPRSGAGVFFVALASLMLLSLPLVTKLLIAPLQQAQPADLSAIDQSSPTIIVVLGAGRADRHIEYGGDTINEITLARVRYAAWMERRTQLPILVSGGRVDPDEERAEANLMQDVLQKEFLLKAEFVEGDSRNTFENALYSAKILKQINMTHIYLVTTAWHMPRAKRSFESQGLQVEPAPTAFYGKEKTTIHDFIPSAKALRYSYFAIHEYLGLMWYAMRYY